MVAFLATVAYFTVAGPRYRVEVCMAYQGHTNCRTVSAKSEESALRSATENACADIATGVTETMRCQQLAPQRMRWIERPRP
ncbi:MAG: hypothetical protein JOY62_05655 [Acidobacteriaceae bacterium]|nr:hypothetical protein [Acidobacteriaceae bacterium]MBV9779443.1 hypothetical protein [Acidobacteriaceae bacterium]